MTGLDIFNPLFEVLHARSKDTPGKLWWHAEAMHPALFRALKMDPDEDGAVYAAVPFRLHRSDDGVRVLAALPTPRILAPHHDDDWLGIETVLAWNPVDDTAEVVGDPGPELVGAVPPDADTLHVHRSPFAFFRAFAEARAQWFTARCSIGGDWHHKPAEPDLTPGLLLIGEPVKVRWPLGLMPDNLTCHGLDASALNRVLIRQARLPRAIAAPTNFRMAA